MQQRSRLKIPIGPQKGPYRVALQGGGSHGAFTWGVLDRLLEEPRFEIVGISGTTLALEAFGEEPFLYVLNNDRNSELLNDASNAKKINIISHGLNNLQGFHNVYFAAALNRHPKHFAMLKGLGLSRK